MKHKALILIAIAALMFAQARAQSSKTAYDFEKPILVDSNSTLLIPTRYSSDFLASNKMSIWGDFYSNVLFYNFKTDSYKKLFEKDTYIVSFTKPQYNRYNLTSGPQNENICSNWIFYAVHNADHNKSGRIDHYDPAILYVSDLHGENLRALTTENENVLNMEFFVDQGFMLVKMQRDADMDGDFEREDRDYYYVKLDFKTMTFGNKIELK